MRRYFFIAKASQFIAGRFVFYNKDYYFVSRIIAKIVMVKFMHNGYI